MTRSRIERIDAAKTPHTLAAPSAAEVELVSVRFDAVYTAVYGPTVRVSAAHEAVGLIEETA
eukprot:scaffold242681_cov34-Tisochrysis_lutea.AAC.2